MEAFLWHVGVLLKDFGQFVEAISDRVQQASLALAQRTGRPIKYLPSRLDRGFNGERVSDYSRRVEGLRVKHSADGPRSANEPTTATTTPWPPWMPASRCRN